MSPLRGCGGGGGGGGGALLWLGGWLSLPFYTPHDRVFRAARSALHDLDVVLEDEELEADRGVLDGYGRDSKRVMVKTQTAGDKATKVRIRVGLWGNQQRSLQILEQLNKHL